MSVCICNGQFWGKIPITTTLRLTIFWTNLIILVCYKIMIPLRLSTIDNSFNIKCVVTQYTLYRVSVANCFFFNAYYSLNIWSRKKGFGSLLLTVLWDNNEKSKNNQEKNYEILDKRLILLNLDWPARQYLLCEL